MAGGNMPKKRKKDDYYVPAPDTKRRCVITGCTAPVVAQVDDDSADGWKLLRGYSRKKKVGGVRERSHYTPAKIT
jgi:hypothetical protein